MKRTTRYQKNVCPDRKVKRREPNERKKRTTAASSSLLTATKVQVVHPMKEKSFEYHYEDLESLSYEQREDWLAEQCELFEREIENFIEHKDRFVEKFHKKLRKITRRWASWNHRNFGQVTSREQVSDLLIWSRQNDPKFQLSLTTNDSEEENPLETFEEYCEKSDRLLRIFRQSIYRPLCDYFSGDDADSVITEIKVLEKCVQKWEALLQFPINEKLFDKQSEKIVVVATRTLPHECDSIVRLIPDLYEKKREALRLARKWRLAVKAKCIQRRGTYTLSPRPLSKRENMSRCRVMAVSHEHFETKTKCYDEINQELKDTKYQLAEVKNELLETRRACGIFENEIKTRTHELNKLREDCQQTDALKKLFELRLNDSHVSQSSCSHPLSESNDITREKLWHRELESIKLKYSAQKIKYLNARKLIDSLNKQLESSIQKHDQLENKAEQTGQKCSKLEEQLEVCRKNLQTQGNMVDALQHQCYTLKHDLDQSNIKKGDLYSQLNSSLERCKIVETDLKQTRKLYQELQEDNIRRKSREELLERENTRLRYLLDSRRRSKDEQQEQVHYQPLHQLPSFSSQNPTIKKSDCLFPDINTGRSL